MDEDDGGDGGDDGDDDAPFDFNVDGGDAFDGVDFFTTGFLEKKLKSVPCFFLPPVDLDVDVDDMVLDSILVQLSISTQCSLSSLCILFTRCY